MGNKEFTSILITALHNMMVVPSFRKECIFTHECSCKVPSNSAFNYSGTGIKYSSIQIICFSDEGTFKQPDRPKGLGQIILC